ncbi:type-1 angiotensin II receptor-associated protein-like [Uranotaenia lowii]|uniref:type-1 angiotensin II receptor-associated protein-like n=1 Tax=Uranotaenia lowii TaxID=190385 RepID=UPI002478CF3C|nr:type-1 angiotensin II receptor-associated protein-like [Uranotaenia lowii]XP_055585978.1 type-1 angiotensin II receptor-associated protein-like [Uranotaenia lowii]
MDVQNGINTPHVRVKLVTFVHFVLIVFALLGNWLPSAYLFYNIIYMAALFWSIHCRESIDAVHIAALVNATSFMFDLLSIISWFPDRHILSAVMAIFNMALRPFTLLVLYRELMDRGGSFAFGIAVGQTERRPTSYEDIDRPVQHQSFSPGV